MSEAEPGDGNGGVALSGADALVRLHRQHGSADAVANLFPHPLGLPAMSYLLALDEDADDRSNQGLSMRYVGPYDPQLTPTFAELAPPRRSVGNPR